jgi:3-oxoacyl-[acyl-carrier-protein] synthase-3
MQIAPAAPGSRILGMGHHQPANVVTNADLIARGVETTDEWIQSRVGIAQRRIALADESVVDMAEAAGSKAIAASGVDVSEIDLVIVATCTMVNSIPNAAAQLATRLGIASPGAFDINAACAGFVYATAQASAAVLSGQARNVLVVGSEKLSTYTDPDDRSTNIIFADGAGVDPSEIAAFIPHQANLRIIEAIAKKVGAVNAVIARDIVNAGNTSAASIPLAMSRMVERGEIPSGAPVLIIGFGAGLTFASQVVLAP